MGFKEEVSAKLDRIDESQKNIAADIRSIKEGILAGEDQASILDRLEASATALESLDAETPAAETSGDEETE